MEILALGQLIMTIYRLLHQYIQPQPIMQQELRISLQTAFSTGHTANGTNYLYPCVKLIVLFILNFVWKSTYGTTCRCLTMTIIQNWVTTDKLVLVLFFFFFCYSETIFYSIIVYVLLLYYAYWYNATWWPLLWQKFIYLFIYLFIT